MGIEIDKNNPVLWTTVLTLGIAGALFYSFTTGLGIARRYTPLIDAAMEIKLEATTAHLWFEEIIGGDQSLQIEDVWVHVDQAQWYAQAMLDGGENQEGTFVGVDDPVLRDEIKRTLNGLKQFRAIAQERWKFQSGIGSEVDQRFDQVFGEFIASADDVETLLKQEINVQLQRFRMVQGFLILVAIILGIGLTFLLRRHRRIRESHMAQVQESENRYKCLFESSEVSVWNEDYSRVMEELQRLQQNGVSDLRQYLVENSHVAWDIARMVNVKHVNKATLKLFKASSEQQLLGSIDKVFGPKTIGVFIDQLCAFWDKKTEFYSEATQRTLDGEVLHTIISMPIPETDEGFNNIPVSIFDITARKRTEEQLATQSQIVSNMVESASLTRVSDSRIVYTNPSMDRMFGYEPGELLGKHTSILNAPTKLSQEEEADTILGQLRAHGKWHGEICNIRKDGAIFWCSTNISTFQHSSLGEVWVSVNTDITARRQAEEKLSYQASHDALTGLINRHEFEQRVNRLISSTRNDTTEHAMCFMDLDQFKIINDTCGHPAGDELLRRLGKLLQDTVRKRDTLARLGGDEFGVLMEHCSLDQAHRVADDILQAVKNYQFSWEGEIFRVGVSIGLIAITETTGNFTNLFKQADAACYLAKDSGRNRIHVYRPDDVELTVRHGEMQWAGRISRALDDNRFCLYGQPIVSLAGNGRNHYELLVRMLDEQGEIIPTGAFMPAAERYSLIEKLDTWVVNHALAFLAEHLAFVKQIDCVSINLSGPSLSNKNTLETMIRNFNKFGVPPDKICFEITETVAITNLEAATKFMSILKQKGCRFALDDFGSGLSSFAYLKNLPVDYLKIGGMFVRDIADDPIDQAMVKSINDIGHAMGMMTIAEFVENDAIKDKLIEIGVDYAQGYGIGKPQPITDIPGNVVSG